MEKKVTLSNGKEYVVKEVLYKDIIDNSSKDKSEVAKILLKLSANLSDDEYNVLTMRDGIKLQKEVNEVNGFGEKDFLQLTPKE
jgi:hypothetical protein